MSSADLLSKFDELVKQFKQQFNEIVESERAKMKAEVEAYEAEKLKMNAVKVSDDDILELNIGGQKITTKRSTLCQVEGSFLASMFSGRWENKLSRDKDGCIFFDFNPQHFLLILEFLRVKKFASPEKPKVPEDQAKNFYSLVGYLGLSGVITRLEVGASEKFNLRSNIGVSLQEGGKVAVHDSSIGHKYALGENVYKDGVVKLKLKIESFQNNNWMMVGIVNGNVVPKDDNSACWSSSYGCVVGSNSGVGIYKNGLFTTDSALRNQTKQGDIINLVLDCDAAKLSLHLPTRQQFHIDLPKSQTWRLNIDMFGANDKIRIMDD